MAAVSQFASLRKGTRSSSARATLSGGANDTIPNSGANSLVSALAPASGPLYDFLTATYADETAVTTAFNAATTAGVVILQPRSGAGVAGLAWIWVAGASTPSVQLVNAAAAGTFDVTILLQHSVIT
jgi:hypothetical protein